MKKSELKALIREVVEETVTTPNPEEVLSQIAQILDEHHDDIDAVLQIRTLVKNYFNKVGYIVKH